MKYLRIVLSGYRRMQLNSIDYFELRIDSPLQLILGTNGSGKSSLLWELSPLPANKDDFMPGGSKVIDLEHRGHLYTIASSFVEKPTYSFIFEGQELNKSGLVTVQKELVKEHFGLTQEVHEVLCGQETFDTMATNKRKDWFLRLCDVNYDYALQVWGKLKNAHRDRIGAIRLERKAVVVESEKLLSDQEVAQLTNESQKLHECLNLLLEYRKPVESDRTTLEIQSSQLDKQLFSMAKAFEELHQRINDREHSDAELVELIEETGYQMVQAQTRVTMLAEQHEQVSRKLNVLMAAGENTIGGLEEQLAAASAELALKTASLMLGKAIEQPERALAAFDSVYLSLLEIFNEIPVNAERNYSQPTLQKAREDLNEQMRIKNNVLEKMAERRASVSHMRDHMGKPDVSCPKCQHQFSLVYSEERLQNLHDDLTASEDQLNTVLIPRIAELEAYIAECTSYASLYRQYVQLTANTATLLKPYWDWLLERRTIGDNPRGGAADLARIALDLRAQMDLSQLLNKRQELSANLEMLKSVGEADAAQLKQQAQELEETLSRDTNELQVAQEQNRHYKSQFDLRRQAGTIRRNIRKAIRAQTKLMTETVEHDRRMILNQLIRDMQSALATREHALHAAQRQKEVVESMMRKIDRLVKEEEALGVLVKELSPTEGLIAEGMLGFIKNFCDQMNDIIARVWTYPLEIQSCELIEGESIDLDYRFPLVQGDDGRKVSDVVKGSTGMREIINLAFRMMAMRYLNLEDYPLYLDELGATFDKEHRAAAANLIRALVEQHTFPQVFMISHYQGVYGALANPQVCVLDPSNILVPEKYNEHVIMR